ncbi:integrase zinc binding domain-containing protein, partial [Staphylococcus aureus]
MCKFETFHTESLTKHMSTHSTSVDILECHMCKYETIYKSSFTKHMKTHNKPNKCTICSQSFPSQLELSTHMLQNEGGEMKCDRSEVLEELHGGISGGHLGINKTITKVRERFYWLHLRDDVEDCKRCKVCGKSAFRESCYRYSISG